MSSSDRTRELRFFYLKDFGLENDLKFLTNVKIHKIFLPEMRLNWHTKNVNFLGENANKMFKKDKFDNKNCRDSSLGQNKFILRSNSFFPDDNN